jgi:rubrerythrin
MGQTTIGNHDEMRDRLRELKGVEQTYNELLFDLLEVHEQFDIEWRCETCGTANVFETPFQFHCEECGRQNARDVTANVK